MIDYIEIESIEEFGDDETYDIWNYDTRCDDGSGGNFLIDGVIVHNSIPIAVANRDDPKHIWKNKLQEIHPRLYEILADTYGIILWQEQLQALWQELAGFTAPEAQEARKAVAKKWTHKLKPIREKWLMGASKTIGESKAIEYWQLMESFGRYAFNKSHGVSYCLVAFRCLWLKAHFAPEFWAAVMSDCHPDKLVRYMSVARAEDWKPTDITYSGKHVPSKYADGVKFGTLNINNLTVNFTVTNDVVNQGLIGIKKVGEKAAQIFEGKGEWLDIDHFVGFGQGRRNKTVLERFIKLGAFASLSGHSNSRAVWMWYQYKYCTGNTEFKNSIKNDLLKREGWNEQTIAAERQRQIAEFKRNFPTRNKIPPKFKNWIPKPIDAREKVMALFIEDFSSEEKLNFQKEFLGYYLDSPLDLFHTRGGCSIKDAKNNGVAGLETSIEAMIVDIQFALTKARNGREGTQYARLTITDGVQRALVFIWNNELCRQDAENLVPGVGIRIKVNFDKQRGTFSMCRNANIIRLRQKNEESVVV